LKYYQYSSIGEKSPLLIDSSSLAILPDNAVLVDLSSGEGGNILGSKEDQVVIGERGIKIINVSGYPKTEPGIASEAFAQCMVNLLADVMTPAGEMCLEHPVLCQKRTNTT
jgi:NAD/NADP transhydrogenase alpha subunit